MKSLRREAKRIAKEEGQQERLKSQVMKVSKKGKARKIRTTVYPKGGGYPYMVDVEPEDDTIMIGDSAYHIVRGSVVQDVDGLQRTSVAEGLPHTINFQALQGEVDMHPTTAHGIIKNNYIKQMSDISKDRGLWKQAGTYGMILIGVGMLLMMFWGISTLGTGLEALAESNQMLAESLANGGGQGATGTGGAGAAAAEAGHNPIAPGGR